MSRTTIRSLLALVALIAFALVPAATAGAKSGHHHRSAKKARSADRNRDGLPDRWERRNGLSLRVNQASRDQDRDSVTNLAEFAAGTDPRDDDSDDDGVEDGQETIGTIASFESGVLVIALGDGREVTGRVTDRTEVECENGGAAHAASDTPGEDDGDHADREDDDRSSDQGEDDQGEDEPGEDDQGEDDSGCTVAALVAGANVHEAELKLTRAGAVWDEIELEV